MVAEPAHGDRIGPLDQDACGGAVDRGLGRCGAVAHIGCRDRALGTCPRCPDRRVTGSCVPQCDENADDSGRRPGGGGRPRCVWVCGPGRDRPGRGRQVRGGGGRRAASRPTDRVHHRWRRRHPRVPGGRQWRVPRRRRCTRAVRGRRLNGPKQPARLLAERPSGPVPAITSRGDVPESHPQPDRVRAVGDGRDRRAEPGWSRSAGGGRGPVTSSGARTGCSSVGGCQLWSDRVCGTVRRTPPGAGESVAGAAAATMSSSCAVSRPKGRTRSICSAPASLHAVVMFSI